jgi:phosphatidylserine/phosphatidylglycerophosphate/cardiolipin synthase-like enzyme
MPVTRQALHRCLLALVPGTGIPSPGGEGVTGRAVCEAQGAELCNFISHTGHRHRHLLQALRSASERVLSSTRYFVPARLGMATSILSSACLAVRATVGKSVLCTCMPRGKEDGRHGVPADGYVDTLYISRKICQA